MKTPTGMASGSFGPTTAGNTHTQIHTHIYTLIHIYIH
jgi:hypothetical protein